MKLLAAGENFVESRDPARKIEIMPDWYALVNSDASKALLEQEHIRKEFESAFSEGLICARASNATKTVRNICCILNKMPFFHVDADIRKAKTLSSEFYTDERYFELSKKMIFARTWQFAGHADDIVGLQPLTILPDPSGATPAFQSR